MVSVRKYAQRKYQLGINREFNLRYGIPSMPKHSKSEQICLYCWMAKVITELLKSAEWLA